MISTMRRQRPGIFLVLVLIVITVATMAVYSFTELMLAYDDSAYLTGDLVQARVNVESASESIRLMLAQPPDMRVDFGGVYNNPQLFQAVTTYAGDDALNPSNFTVIAPALSETGSYGGIRFGLQDESARLNINTLTVLEENSEALSGLLTLASAASEDTDETVTSDNIAVTLLLALPGMTEDIADAILDWLDEDEEPRPYGAEIEYYSTLPTPYEPNNGPLQSVEELLLVRGVTPTLLFGADVNRNGVIDPDEQQRFGITVDTPGALGWASYLTVHGAEANKRKDGTPRIFVNQEDLEILYEDLLEGLGNDLYASYVVAYRYGGQSTSAASALANIGNGTTTAARSGGAWTPDVIQGMDLTAGGGTSVTQILDLVGSTVTIGNGDNATSYTSPFPADPISMSIYMPILMDALTTQESPVMPGRINVNECPAELLYGIPMLSEEVVQAILENREAESDDPNRDYETWLLTDGLVTLDEMRLLVPLLSGRGDVYRAQVVGYFETSGAAHRAEVIIDATTVNPKIVAWRDLTHLGRGFDLSVLGLRMPTELTQ
ncbi:MAG: general secretion pathway protein GspK [Planctomycetaceae bacterium]|jgi:type II secretory pathway component PulK|nr:general secretion pathway protein GspK [Planctomycetaceae bacterium]